MLIALPAALLAGVLVSPTAAVAGTASRTDAVTPAGRFYPITPVRVLDTRGVGGPILNAAERLLALAPALGGNAAAAVVINLTVTAPTSSGYLTVYPAGTDKPLASSINFDKGQTRANSVTVAVGQDANQNQLAISAAVAGNGSTQVIVDVLGWYGDGGGLAGTSYQPLVAPKRLFDTRDSTGPLTTTYPRNVGIVTLDYGSPTINRTITAVVINITVTGPKGGGYLTIWNGFGVPPLVSTLNFVAGQTVANLAFIPVRCVDLACTKLTFSIKNNISPSTQVLGDISGAYVTPTRSGLLYQPLSPTRITDTRLRQPYGRLGPGGTGTTDVSRVVVAGTRAVNINLTAVRPSTSTYLTVYPAGTTRPLSSALNVGPANIAANAVQVRLSTDDAFVTFNFAGTVDVVIDLQGMFVPDTSLSSGAAPSGVVGGIA